MCMCAPSEPGSASLAVSLCGSGCAGGSDWFSASTTGNKHSGDGGDPRNIKHKLDS